MNPIQELCAKVCEELAEGYLACSFSFRSALACAAAIRALPQSEIGAGEAVAWRFKVGDLWFVGPTKEACLRKLMEASFPDGSVEIEPLYAAPAALPDTTLDSRRLDWLDQHCAFVADSEYNIGPFSIGELRQLADAGMATDWVTAQLAATQGANRA